MQPQGEEEKRTSIDGVDDQASSTFVQYAWFFAVSRTSENSYRFPLGSANSSDDPLPDAAHVEIPPAPKDTLPQISTPSFATPPVPEVKQSLTWKYVAVVLLGAVVSAGVGWVAKILPSPQDRPRRPAPPRLRAASEIVSNGPDEKLFVVRIIGDPKQVAKDVQFCVEAFPEVESLGVPSFENSQVELDNVMHLKRERVGPAADCYKIGRFGTDETLTIRYPAKFRETPSGVAPALKLRNSGDGYSFDEVSYPRSSLERNEQKPMEIGSESTVAGNSHLTRSETTMAKDCASTGDCTYQAPHQLVAANQVDLYVYKDEDSGLNHGFPSGYVANPMSTLSTIHLNAGCVDDPAADATSTLGCYPSSATNALDTVQGTVMQFSFDAQASEDFAGVNIEGLGNWGTIVGLNQCGAPFSCNGYDLTGVTAVTFDACSNDGAQVSFGVGGCTTSFMPVPSTWTTMTVSIDTLTCRSPVTTQHPNLSDMNVLFSMTVDGNHSPNRATVLLDNIYFTPVPARAAQTQAGETLSPPQSNQAFGVVEQPSTTPSDFFPDQVNRNFAAIYEGALTIQTLLNEGDNIDTQEFADALGYALYHANHGDYLSIQDGTLGGCFSRLPNNQCGLQDAYETGDIALLNDQNHLVLTPTTTVVGDPGKAGDARLAGFTCGTSHCTTQDTGTGGNNSWALPALLYEYKISGDAKYLNDAITIGNWIQSNLADATETGYGGYYVGYSNPGEAPPKTRNLAKSTENNADIFAAFTALAKYDPANAAARTTAANAAGDFVMQMYDETNGRFNNGTDPVSILNSSGNYSPGVCPYGAQKGTDIIDINSSPDCDFIDSDTLTTLAMAASSRYLKYQFTDGSVMDWRRPVQYALSTFAETVTDAGLSYQGFDIVPDPVAAADRTVTNGIPWEYTGQTVETMHYVDQLYNQTNFESQAQMYLGQIQQAQESAPFEDGQGVVASVLQNGNTLTSADRSLNTSSLNCPPERVGLAATHWKIFSAQTLSPLEIEVGAASQTLSYSVYFDHQSSAAAPAESVIVTDEVGSYSGQNTRYSHEQSGKPPFLTDAKGLTKNLADATIYYSPPRLFNPNSRRWITPEAVQATIVRPLRVRMLDSGGAKLTVTSEVHPPAVPRDAHRYGSVEGAIPVRPLLVQMLNNGGAQLTVTSEVDTSVESPEEERIRQMPGRSLRGKALSLISLPSAALWLPD